VRPAGDPAPPRLGALLAEFAAARDRLLRMAEAARRLAMPDADRRVAGYCVEVAHA
jgi:UDP-N-acetylglucosamine--N-acetylmuramyl-(pentapeptide) pyrophosphoryl-undecaprenol N-acetylglucosamine transferase